MGPVYTPYLNLQKSVRRGHVRCCQRRWRSASHRWSPALARVVGRDAYKAGVADALDMLASPSAMLGLGHALLKTVVLSLSPRLKPLYAEVEAAR